MDSYRRQGHPHHPSPSTGDVASLLGLSSGKSPRTYAGLAAAGGKVASGKQEGKQQPRPSAFFGSKDGPSPRQQDLLSKVASLMKQTAPARTRTHSFGDGLGAASPLRSERSTPEDLFGGSSGRTTPQRSASGPARAALYQRPASVTPPRDSLGPQQAPGSSRRSATMHELASGGFASSATLRSSMGPGAELPEASSRGSRRQTADGGQAQDAAAAGLCGSPPPWSEELLNWMLAEKAELLLEVQRAQRRQQELQQELDRVRARVGVDLEEEVKCLKVERRMLLEKLQRLNQQDADSAALLERMQVENDALTTELERSQEVCKEMLAARRAARDALSEMSAQNARLVSAYVEKKQEAAQLKEGMRQQQRQAEARIRALQAELHAAQLQAAELASTLAHAGHRPELAHAASPLPTGHAAGLPGPSPPHRAGSTVQSQGEPAGLEFGASPFCTPDRTRPTPPSRQQQPPQQQQQQHGKENASWSGNRGSASSSAAASRKQPAAGGSRAQEREASPAPAHTASGTTRQPSKGEWDQERAELLSLLERLQHQLSAHAELQASPARQPSPAPAVPPPAAHHFQPQSQQPHHQQAQQQQRRQQDAAAEPQAASPVGLRPFPAPAAGARTPAPSPSPCPEEPESPLVTPLTHRSSNSSASSYTPRRSHFSVPRHSCSAQRASVGQDAEDEGEEGWGGCSSAGSSKHSCQTTSAARSSRRTSGVNLSGAFDQVDGLGCGSAAMRGGGSSSSAAGDGDADSCSAATRSSSQQSEQSDFDPFYAPGFGGLHRPSPPSASSHRQPSPGASATAGTPLQEAQQGFPGQQQPTPVIPPTATPFSMALAAGTQPSSSPQQQHCHQQQAPPAGAADHAAEVPAGPASQQETPERQRLADAEKRNAALEAEVQRLQQLQEEAEERQKREELLRQVDQHKQAGNSAFQQQRYEQAVQEYSAGLELLGDVTPEGGTSSVAVLFCNRAAALHAMGRYLDAIADCYRAEQKDPTYARLYHRRADAYCAIGAYSAASEDLSRLVDMGCGREVAARLAEVQHKLKVQYPVNHYSVLGLKSSASQAEVKAAYRSLALRFHPDKAGQSLPRDAADAIFKLVAAANATLGDAEQRRGHDLATLRHKYRRFYTYQY